MIYLKPVKQKFTTICVGAISLFAFFILVRSIYLTIATFAPDFSVLWMGAKDLAKGFNPYINPNLFTGIGYPPNSLIFYIPFTVLPYQIAQGIFVFLSVLAMFGSILLSFKLVGKGRIGLVSLLLAISLTFFSFPTRFTLGMGQNNLIAFFLLLLVYYLYKEEKMGRAGLILGLVVSLKTIFAFFILFFLLRKQWRVVGFAILTIAVVVGITSIFSIPNLYRYYLKEVVPPLLNLPGREVYYNQGFMGFIARLTSDIVLRRYIWVVLSFVLIYFLFKFRKIKDTNLYFSIFIVALLLIDTLSWQHHFVWLIFPFIVIAKELYKRKLKLLYLILGVAYLLISWNFKNPAKFMEFPVSLVLSNTFYGGVILLLLNIYLVLLQDKSPGRI